MSKLELLHNNNIMYALRTDLAVIVVWTAEVGTINIY